MAKGTAPIWSATKSKTTVENAFGHCEKHAAEFPELANAKQYVETAGSLVADLVTPGVLNLSHSYHSVGTLKSRTEAVSGVSATYTYDALNRLSTETCSSGTLATAQTLG